MEATTTIAFTDGPPPDDGPCVLLMWDGSLCEGYIERDVETGKRMVVTCNFTKPREFIRFPLAQKVIAHTQITGHRKA
jgi:hypothetical protein